MKREFATVVGRLTKMTPGVSWTGPSPFSAHATQPFKGGDRVSALFPLRLGPLNRASCYPTTAPEAAGGRRGEEYLPQGSLSPMRSTNA